jgi:hypothetical protein
LRPSWGIAEQPFDIFAKAGEAEMKVNPAALCLQQGAAFFIIETRPFFGHSRQPIVCAVPIELVVDAHSFRITWRFRAASFELCWRKQAKNCLRDLLGIKTFLTAVFGPPISKWSDRLA